MWDVPTRCSAAAGTLPIDRIRDRYERARGVLLCSDRARSAEPELDKNKWIEHMVGWVMLEPAGCADEEGM